MKRTWLLLLVIFVLWAGTGSAWAAEDPVRSVEVFRKPGFDFRPLKLMAPSIGIDFKPISTWSVEKGDPYLKDRIRDMVKASLKSKGFAFAVDELQADASVKVRVFEWGRFRNTDNQNLIEYVDMEVRMYEVSSGELILRGTARYRLRNNQQDPTMSSLNEAAASMLDEIFYSLVNR